MRQRTASAHRHAKAMILPIGALLLAGVLAVAPLVPPAPREGREAREFSAARAFEHIEAVAGEPRPIGSVANARARAIIVEQLRLLGLEPELQTTRVRDYYSRAGGTVDVVSILARVPGTAPTKAVALIGHFDTVPRTPGANDDASAVGIMLEIARALAAGPRLRNDVILLFADGEEPAPRFGSSAFVAEHPWAEGIGFVINLEALGSGGPSLLTEVSGPQGWTIEQYATAVPYPAAFSFVTATAEWVGGSNSDFASFRGNGVPGVEFAYLHGSPIYHTADDASERVSQRSLQEQGMNTLALIRQLGSVDLLEPRDDSRAVFFTIARLFVVRYPTSWALPIVLGTGLALLAVARRDRTWVTAIQSCGVDFLSAAVAAAAGTCLWIGLASWRSAMRPGEGYVHLGALILLCMAIVAAVARRKSRRIPQDPDAVGALLLWWTLALVSAALAPEMSYLFAWPTLAGALALLCRSSSNSHYWPRLARFALVAVTALVLLVPAIDVFFQLAQPRPGNSDSQALPIIVVPILLIMLTLELVRAFRPSTAPSHSARPRQRPATP